MIKNIVSIGAGTGQAAILKGLVKIEGINITALVTTTDNGWSSALIRSALKIPSPWDVRNVINAINPKEGILSKLLNYRFSEWELSWVHVWNLIVWALSRIQWSYQDWIEVLNQLLKLPAHILPVSNHNAQICAELEDGTVLEGERQIIKREKDQVKVKRYFLNKEYEAVQEWIEALKKADIILICPWVLGTGIISTLLFAGIKESIKNSSAKLVYFANAMTYPSQTDNFTLSDHISLLEKYTGRKIDVAIANTGIPPTDIINNYKKIGAELVTIDQENLTEYNIISENLLIDYETDHKHGELNRSKGKKDKVWLHYIRHDSDLVAHIVEKLL